VQAGDAISVEPLLPLTNSRCRPTDTATAAADVRCLNEPMQSE